MSEEALTIRGTLYRRRIALEHLDIRSARRVRFDEEPKLEPWIRTNGIGLPGYAAGWFRLHSRKRALVFMTHEDALVYIPTKKRFALLLSVDRPDDFLAALGAIRP